MAVQNLKKQDLIKLRDKHFEKTLSSDVENEKVQALLMHCL